MNRLSVWKFGAASAVAFVALSAACALAVALAPEATIATLGNWFHGLDLRLLVPPGGKPVTLYQFVAGSVTVGAVAFLTAAVLAGCYNLMNRNSP